MSLTEHKHRLAFAERQFQQWMQRVTHNHLKAQVELAKGDHVAAAKSLDVAKNWIEHVNTCNETIDGHRRALDPGDDDPPNESNDGPVPSGCDHEGIGSPGCSICDPRPVPTGGSADG